MTGILHGKSASYLSELMPNTFSMAPRYVRDFARPDRVRLAGPRRVRRPRREARPPVPRAAAADAGVALLGDARDVAPASPRGPARPRPAGACPARRDLAAVPARRQVRLLQLAADLVPRVRRARRSTPRSTTPTTASPIWRSCATSSPGCGRSSTDDAVVVLVIGDVETDRGRPIRGRRRARRAGLGAAAEPEGYRLAGVALDDVAAVRKMTKLWGDEAGRATKTDRILVLGATEAGRRRALAGAAVDVDWDWPPRALRAI